MIPAFAAGALVVGALAVWRPTVALAGVLLSLAVGLHWTLDDTLPREALRWLAPGHKAVVLAALLGCALRFGLRGDIRNWPLLAIAWLIVQTAWLAAPGPPADRVAVAAFAFAVPWLIPQVAFGEGRRDLLTHVVALTPLLSVGLGLVLQLAGVHSALAASRLQGATNAGWLGFLAYAAFAICLHEAVRGRWRRFGGLAAVNLAVAVLTAGRMAVFACVVHGLVYAVLSPELGRRLGRRGLAALVVGAAVVSVAVFFYLPVLQARMTGTDGLQLNMSGRDRLIVGYLDEFRGSPLFGRGLGAASLAWNYFDLPHNEYVRLLVEGGVVGFTAFAAAVVVWARRLRRRVDPGDRPFVGALFASLATYALTDNVLIMPPGLMAFALLGIVLTAAEPKTGAAQAVPGTSTGTPRSTT